MPPDLSLLDEAGFEIVRKGALAAAQARLAEAERERDLAIAHDRQPYPTADAYERACSALNVMNTRAMDFEDRLRNVQNQRDALRSRCEAMREGLKQAVELLDEVKAQWGADYLWEKWGLTAAIEKVRAALAAAQEPQA